MKKHNWLTKLNNLNKLSSITFSITDSYKIAQPKNLLDIAFLLFNWIKDNVHDNVLDNNNYDTVSPDGMDDFMNYIGIINCYLPKETSENPNMINKAVNYINLFIQNELIPMGIKTKPIFVNKSNSTGLNTIRIPISHNETENIEQLPQLNVANRNAKVVLDMLNIPSEPYGQIDANQLIPLIQKAKSKIEHFTLSPSINKNYYESGISKEQLNIYLDVLENMANVAIKMNNPTITWG